jgi:hypothetical protein
LAAMLHPRCVVRSQAATLPQQTAIPIWLCQVYRELTAEIKPDAAVLDPSTIDLTVLHLALLLSQLTVCSRGSSGFHAFPIKEYLNIHKIRESLLMNVVLYLRPDGTEIFRL